MLNYLIGKQRNQSVANKWFAENIDALSEQFALVGDDGVSENPGKIIVKETDCSYLIWSSGRVGVQSMSSQLKLIKRQDIAGLIYNYIQPKLDKVVHKVEMDKGEIDSVVIAFGNKKSVTKAFKELADLVGLLDNYSVLKDFILSVHLCFGTKGIRQVWIASQFRMFC